jgi:GT2 family glycosyltransferase
MSYKLSKPMKRCQKVAESLFHQGTGRRHYYELALSGIRVVLNEGWGSFYEKVKIWLRLRKTAATRRLLTLPTFKASISRREAEELVFPAPREKPEVSIVIPVHNNWRDTLNCLKSIRENTNGDYEAILVDDASSDETAEVLSKVKNLRVIRNEQNVGFVGSCNHGAKSIKGKFILFLNNDTMVAKNWLPPLLEVIRREDAGGVGSKLIYPDGTLQEAGGIIWKNGSGLNYGRGDDRNKPEYNYVREVDYCSGASLMVRRDFFEQLGGFDSRYSPAYEEDTDLCFSIRKLGYKVLYQPASVVVHFEGISAGRNTASGMKKYQEINKPKFIEKWADELEKQYEYRPENIFLARDRNRNKRILVIDHGLPTYDKDAGSFFMFSLLRALRSMGHRLVFWPDNLYPVTPYTGILQQMGIEVIYNSVNFKNYLRKFGKFFDIAILARPHIAIRYIKMVKKYIPIIVHHDFDLEFIREQRRMELEGGSEKSLKKIREREFYLFNNSNLITTHNPEEGKIIQEEIPNAKVVIIPLPTDKVIETKTPFEDRDGLLFVGSTHPPNADAVSYFAKEIMPHLNKKLPALKLYVVGSDPSKKVTKLNSDSIIVTGFVKDLLPYFERCRVYVVPLRYGAGVKGKIIEAMSYGLPVVTTSIGAEGLNLSHGGNTLISDHKEDFIESVEKLYHDKVLWNKIRENALNHVKENFSQEVFFAAVKQMMESL